MVTKHRFRTKQVQGTYFENGLHKERSQFPPFPSPLRQTLSTRLFIPSLILKDTTSHIYSTLVIYLSPKSLQKFASNLPCRNSIFSKIYSPPPLCKNGDGVETESYVILLIGSVIGFVNRFHCYRSKELPYSPISFYLRFWVY